MEKVLFKNLCHGLDMPQKSPIILLAIGYWLLAIRPDSSFFLKSHVKSLANTRPLGFAAFSAQ